MRMTIPVDAHPGGVCNLQKNHGQTKKTAKNDGKLAQDRGCNASGSSFT